MIPDLECISGIAASSLKAREFDGVPVMKFPESGLELLEMLSGGERRS